MKTLILKKTGAHYRQPWSDNDYVVLNAGQVVGRIMLHPQAPRRHSWFWMITKGLAPGVYNRGYAATRLQAMTDFKARLLN